MADRIKGITIEIGGDTTKLQTALKGVNKEIRESRAELRDINKLLKFDPGNTELLKQKQSALSREIAATEEKLEKEKEALRQAAAENVPDEKQAALKREVIDTERQLKAMKKEMKNFGNVAKQQLDVVGDKFQNVGDKISGAGQSLLPVTAGLAAAGAGAVAAYKDVDTGLDTVTKKTGASGEALEEMQEIVKRIPTTFNTSFETAGEAVGEVNTRFGLTGDELESLSSQFIQFAQLNNTDVTSSVDAVQKALAAFGLDASHAGALLDALNATGQKTGVSVDTLAAGLVTNSAAFQGLGLSVEQSTALMGQMEVSGANTSAVMSGLRKALKNATEQGIPLDEALSTLQDTIVNGTGDVDGLTAAYDLFGKSGDQIYTAIQNGTLDFNALGAAVEDAGGSVTDTFEATQDPTDEFMTALNGVKEVGAEVGATLLESLTPALESLKDVIQDVSSWWKNLDEDQQQFILKAAGIVAAIAPVLMVIGKVSTGIGAVIKVVGALTGALFPAAGAATAAATATAAEGTAAAAATPAIAASGTAASGASVGFGALNMSLLPIIGIIAGIIAAIAAVILIIKNWGKVSAWFKALWEKISTFLKETWEGIKEGFTETWEGIKQFGKTTWEAIKTIAAAAWEAIKFVILTPIRLVKEGLLAVWNAIKAFLEREWNGIKKIAEFLWLGIKNVITAPIQTAKNIISAVVGAVRKFLQFTGLYNTVKGVFDSIKNAITSPIETAKSIVSKAISFIKNLFPLNIGKIFSDVKLPHFKISGGEAPWGIMGKGKRPSIDIEWYAKAMRDGMILNSPTIFGAANGSLLGAGEAGAEAIVGARSLSSMISASVTAAMTAMSSTIAMATYKAVSAAMENGRPIEANLFMFKNSPQMGKWIVETYDTYKARLG
jgi:TP901 family phage tail tape measure protein